MTEALETFAFNVAVARIHEFANAIADAAEAAPGARAARGAGDARAPVRADDAAPGRGGCGRCCARATRALVAQLPWPEADPALLAAET